MIVNLTQEFILKFNEFDKQNLSLKINKDQKVIPRQQKKISDIIDIEYQMSLKYAKDVQDSLCIIQDILRDKKDNYFSNAAYSLSSFTNQQRNQFDQQTKIAFKVTEDKIQQLRISSERINQNNQRVKRGSPRSIYSDHLKQVIICLHCFYRKLQTEFAQFLKYNQLKKKKILNTLSIQPQKKYKEPKYFQKRENDLSKADLSNTNQQLQRQAHLFYLQKIQDQKKAQQTKQTIISINEMLGLMGQKVLDQQLLTSSFEQIGAVGLNYIEQGNKNLMTANTLSKQSGQYWVFLFLGMAFSLLFVDFLKS